MRLDFEIGAFKFMYIGDAGNEDKALDLFKQMTDQIGKVLPSEIVQALVAADPDVITAMKESVIRDFAKKFDEQVIEPLAEKLEHGQAA
jgi:hypothetical protein